MIRDRNRAGGQKEASECLHHKCLSSVLNLTLALGQHCSIWWSSYMGGSCKSSILFWNCSSDFFLNVYVFEKVLDFQIFQEGSKEVQKSATRTPFFTLSRTFYKKECGWNKNFTLVWQSFFVRDGKPYHFPCNQLLLWCYDSGAPLERVPKVP